MLVLTRHASQGILIGTDVVVVVKEISRSAVRLGIEAPSDVPIHRYEIAEKIIAGGGSLDSQIEAIHRSKQDLLAEIDSLRVQLKLAERRAG